MDALLGFAAGVGAPTPAPELVRTGASPGKGGPGSAYPSGAVGRGGGLGGAPKDESGCGALGAVAVGTHLGWPQFGFLSGRGGGVPRLSRQRDEPDRYPGLPKEALDVNPLPPQIDQSGLDRSCQPSLLPFPFQLSLLPVSCQLSLFPFPFPFPFSSLGKGGGTLPRFRRRGRTPGRGFSRHSGI